MTSTQRVWLTPQAHDRLEAELAALLRPTTTAAAGDTLDQDEDVPTRHHQRHARIRLIHDLLGNAVVGQDPPDDGIAEPGMVLTVHYDDTDDTETFLLGARGAEDGELEVYSPDSPLGTACSLSMSDWDGQPPISTDYHGDVPWRAATQRQRQSDGVVLQDQCAALRRRRRDLHAHRDCRRPHQQRHRARRPQLCRAQICANYQRRWQACG